MAVKLTAEPDFVFGRRIVLALGIGVVSGAVSLPWYVLFNHIVIKSPMAYIMRSMNRKGEYVQIREMEKGEYECMILTPKKRKLKKRFCVKGFLEALKQCQIKTYSK